MGRWKIAGATVLFAAVFTAFAAFTPGVKGQDRPEALPRAERAWRVSTLFGSQIGVTVREGESGGVVVDDVRQGSPAEKAGVKPGDTIVEFDGERVRSSRQFARIVDETPQGRSVKMTVTRNGQRTTLDVAPEAREFGRIAPLIERFRMPEPPEAPRPPRLPRDFEMIAPDVEVLVSRGSRLGVQIEDLEDQLAEYFGVKRGVLVTKVTKDSPAGRAGLKAGDVITKVGGTVVDDTRDLRRELRRIDAGQEFALEVMRDRKPATFKVTLDPPRASTRRPGTATEWF